MTRPLDPASPYGQQVAKELARVFVQVERAIAARKAKAATSQPQQEGPVAA